MCGRLVFFDVLFYICYYGRVINLSLQYMDAETKQEFENLAVIIAGSFEKVDKQFEDLRATMATKEDLKQFATKDDLAKVESRLDAKIDSVESRLGAKINGVEGSLSEKIADLKETVEKLDVRDKADTDALASDVLNLRQRVETLEARP